MSSQARNTHASNVGEGEYGDRLTRSSDASLFTNITEKVSTGIEQVAGFIQDKTQNLAGGPTSNSIADLGRRTASALNSSASYLKQADFDQMQGDLKRTIKNNPEKSLLISLGVGILLGMMFRKKG